MEYVFTNQLWEWTGEGAWCFITVPSEYYEEIKFISAQPTKGFGSVKVTVILGNSQWNTSIFPDSITNSFLLPIKKEIRKAENIVPGDTVSVKIIIKNDQLASNSVAT